MADLHEELRTAIADGYDDLVTLANRVLNSANLVSDTPPAQLEQLVRALQAMLLEGLEGGTETQDFVIATAVPAYIDAGETAATIAGASVRFSVELAELLGGRVSPGNRAAAVAWVADYYGAYTRRTIEAVQEAGTA